MQPWQLPEHVADILPIAARQSESAREQVLEPLHVYDYELVQPLLMEYSGPLLTHIDEGLSLKVIRMTDQVSGRQLGIRADITPQVARIDAHLLSTNEGIDRLCYTGPVLHARPDGLLNIHEPLQIDTELYGFANVAVDIELIDLMLKSMGIADIGGVLLSLGYIGVSHALAHAVGLDEVRAARLLSLMQNRDVSAISEQVTTWRLDGIWAEAFALLPTLYGGREIPARARAELPDLGAISEALGELEAVCKTFPLQQIHVDLSELYVDEYHAGLLFATYGSNRCEAVACGGCYDGLGVYSGRSRLATGFGSDMRTSAGRPPVIKHLPLVAAAHEDVEEAEEAIGRLCTQGQCVMVDYGVGCNGS